MRWPSYIRRAARRCRSVARVFSSSWSRRHRLSSRHSRRRRRAANHELKTFIFGVYEVGTYEVLGTVVNSPKSGPKFRIALPSKRRPWDQAPLSTTKPTSIGEGRVQPHGERREEGTRPRGLAPNEKAGVLRVFLWRTIGAARRQQLSLWGGVSSLSKLFSETAVRPALGVAAVLLPILGTVALWLWIDAEEHWV